MTLTLFILFMCSYFSFYMLKIVKKILVPGTENELVCKDVKIMYLFMCIIILVRVRFIGLQQLCTVVMSFLYLYRICFPIFKSCQCDLYNYPFNLILII